MRLTQSHTTWTKNHQLFSQTSYSAMETTKQFPQFPNLPPEIRLLIWRECLPFRVFEIDTRPRREWLLPTPRKLPPCTFRWSHEKNYSPPVIAQVCRESRAVALESRSNEERMLHEPPSRWFSPRLSIAFMHGKPVFSDDWEQAISRVPDLHWYADRCGAAGFDASVMHEFDNEEGYAACRNGFLDAIAERKDYPVCVETVVIHASVEAARNSGLFGLLGDAPLQLVDATDARKIARFQALWETNLQRDMAPESFFRDQTDFQSRIVRWSEEVESLWVYNDWYKAFKNGWQGVVEPEEIWELPYYEFGNAHDMLVWRCSSFDDDPEPLDYFLISENPDHPFVQQSWAAMPRFHPRVLFSLCPLDCHLQKENYDPRLCRSKEK